MTYEYLENMAPLLMQVELTEACNLRCKFCYNSQKPRYNERIFEILEKLAKQGVMQINLTGGEPLMHPHFFEILEKACLLFPNVVILSNGSLMTEEALEKIHSYDVTSVNISIHGDEDSHEELTQVKDCYQRSINAIKYFLDRKKIMVASNFVLNGSNFHMLESTIKSMNEIGLEFMTITRFIPIGIGSTARDLILTEKQLIEAFRIVYNYNKSGMRPHIEFAEATPFCALPEKLQSLANCCSYGYDRFYVDVTGELMVCGLSRIKLGGNILEKSINDIKKKSPVFNKFIKNEHVSDKCKGCEKFELCHGGCRAAALSNGKWDGSPDPNMKL
ncbi:MAG: radical SAM protein [Clostridium sp.]|nr:radical SAM protein [Clostridium sp.]